jgi:hypothetical protein
MSPVVAEDGIGHRPPVGELSVPAGMAHALRIQPDTARNASKRSQRYFECALDGDVGFNAVVVFPSDSRGPLRVVVFEGKCLKAADKLGRVDLWSDDGLRRLPGWTSKREISLEPDIKLERPSSCLDGLDVAGSRVLRASVLLERANETYWLAWEHFSDYPDELCWIPDMTQRETICADLETVKREARGRIDLLSNETAP